MTIAGEAAGPPGPAGAAGAFRAACNALINARQMLPREFPLIYSSLVASLAICAMCFSIVPDLLSPSMTANPLVSKSAAIPPVTAL